MNEVKKQKSSTTTNSDDNKADEFMYEDLYACTESEYTYYK